jgi:ubiquinone/menaquinone biosynthesis C-methylase UbiE
MMDASRLENEKTHGKRISGHAEEVWGWASPAGKLRADRRAKYLFEMGAFLEGDALLEIGCGTGLFSGKMHEATGAQIVATDISDDLLAVARQEHPEILFVMDDAMNMSFPDKTFDGVFGSSIVHHLDANRSMKEVFRVLKPHGRVVFAEPNMLNPQILVQKNVPFIKRMLGDSPNETAIVRWRMKRLMEEIGFINVRIFPYDFLHPYTPGFMSVFVNWLGRILEKLPIVREIAGSVIIYGEKLG